MAAANKDDHFKKSSALEARKAVLAAICRSLGESSAPPSRPVPDELEVQLEAARPKGTEERIQRFTAELQAVNGEAMRVSSMREAADEVVALLEQENAAALALSGGKPVENLADFLAEHGIEIVRLETATGDRKLVFADVKASLVEAAWGIADSGTVVLTPLLPSQYPAVLSETVIVFLQASRLAGDYFEFISQADPQEYRSGVWITGPSRTADIEKILILGAHGPRRLTVLILNE